MDLRICSALKCVLIIRKKVKKALHKSKLGFYTLNPYVGCQFACRYCYAQLYAKKYFGMDNWGEFVIVRENIPLLLRKEAKPGMYVWLSSMSDPYQPVEAEFELTRKSIEVLGKKRANIDILTKSPLVLRDIDLLKQYEATVGFTIISLERINWEPRAPHPKRRIDALKQLKEEGIKTYVFIGPLLPETDLEAIIRETRDFADFYIIDMLRHVRELSLPPFMPNRKEVMDIIRRLGVKAKVLF